MVERAPEQLKHLEFAQSNIARMHSAAASMKRFALAAFAIGASVARIVDESSIFGITMVVVAAFFLIDAKYLQAERAFRRIYDGIRVLPPDAPATFDLTPASQDVVPFRELGSWSTWLLYGLILAILLGLWLWEPSSALGP